MKCENCITGMMKSINEKLYDDPKDMTIHEIETFRCVKCGYTEKRKTIMATGIGVVGYEKVMLRDDNQEGKIMDSNKWGKIIEEINHARSHSAIIDEIKDVVHLNAKNKGWHDTERSFGELIALCHSELSEALEEYRNGKDPDAVYFREDKPEGIPIELADVIIRIFDMCGLYQIDIGGAIFQKMMYNSSRPHRHGGKVI